MINRYKTKVVQNWMTKPGFKSMCNLQMYSKYFEVFCLSLVQNSSVMRRLFFTPAFFETIREVFRLNELSQVILTYFIGHVQNCLKK